MILPGGRFQVFVATRPVDFRQGMDGLAAVVQVTGRAAAGAPGGCAPASSRAPRVEIDSNVVERSICPLALNRKNALFAGSDQGGVLWGVIASLIETCKLKAVDPQAYLATTLNRLVNRHSASQIDDLMPWAHAAQVA